MIEIADARLRPGDTLPTAGELANTVESYLREYAGLAGCGSNTRGEPDER
jgi:hypothetical protein